MKGNLMVVVAATLTMAAIPMTVRADIPPQVTVDQNPVQFNGQPPVEQGGRVLVPLRGVLEKLGAYVEYDARTQTVTALRGSTKISLPIGGQQAMIGSRSVNLDVPAQIVNGSTLVPLRFVAESLGAHVSFDAGRNLVAIETSGNATSAEYGNRPPIPDNNPPPANSPAANETAIEGTIVSVFGETNPPRIVVHTSEDGGKNKTIPLRDNIQISLRRPGEADRSLEVGQLRRGERVHVLLSDNGRARAIHVMRGPFHIPDQPTAGTFRGEYSRMSRAGQHTWLLRTSQGRDIEVRDDVPVFYNDQKMSVQDLRPGDDLTIAVDPVTKRGTRIVVEK